MEVKVVKENPITKAELSEMAKIFEERLVKAVVDVEQKIMAVGGELHADEATILMEQEGSTREHTWGINIYPEKMDGEDWLEFDSMVNIKPWLNNRTRGVEDEKLRSKIKEIVSSLITGLG